MWQGSFLNPNECISQILFSNNKRNSFFMFFDGYFEFYRWKKVYPDMQNLHPVEIQSNPIMLSLKCLE